MALDNRDEEKQKLFTRRAAVIGGGQLALFTVLAGRMYYLQVIESQEYEILAEENRVNVRLLPPLRGEIVDRFGEKLASNRQNFRVVLIPEQTDDVEATLQKLSEIIDISERTRKRVAGDDPIVMPEALRYVHMARCRDYPSVLADNLSHASASLNEDQEPSQEAA